MANILEQLSQGLRVAGTALSPQAFQADVRKQEQLQSLKAQREEMLMQAATQAVQNGALSPDKFQMLKQQRGWNIPDLGPNVQTQKAQGEMQTQAEADALRKQIDAGIASKYAPPTPQGTRTGMTVGPDGQAILDPVVLDNPANFQETETERAMLYQQTGNPLLMAESRKILADLRAEERAGKQAETPLAKLIRERKALPPDSPYIAAYDAAIADAQSSGGAGTQYERALQTLRTLQMQVNSGKPLSQEQQLEAESARAILQQQRPAVDPNTGQLYYSQPLTVPPSITVGGGPARQAGVLPPLTSGRKPLDAGTEKEFQKIGDGRAQLLAIIAGFKPEYGGFVSDIVGKGAIEGGRRGILPEYADMSQWWQMYEQWITDIRAEKFGLTLTGHELEAMRQYRITTRDTKETIQKNLTRQLKIVDNAIQRRLGAVSQSGQNVKQAEELLGPSTAPAYEDEIPTPKPLNWTDEDEARLKEVEEELKAKEKKRGIK